MFAREVPANPTSPRAKAKRFAALKENGHPAYIPEGKRHYTDTTGPGYKQGWISWLIAITSLTLVACWFHILCGLLLFSWISWVRYVILCMLATLVLPVSTWTGFKNGVIMKSWRQYFNYSVHVKHVLRANDDRGHLFCWFPHGVFAFGWMAASGTEDYFFPDREVSGIAGSSVFHIPLFRHISAWLGGYPATRKNINRLLEKGRSVTFLSVGGMAEMFLTSDRNKEKIHLQDRKGFIRLAIAGGHSIVPMYYFGHSQMLTLWSPKILGGISRRLGFGIGILYGRWGLPIPRPIECMAVSGAPIDCGPKMSRDDPNFNKRVDEIHSIFRTAIQNIFDEHKGEYGWAHKELVIV